jgi:hypothetical protein
MTITLDPPDPYHFTWTPFRVVPRSLRAGLDALTEYQISLNATPKPHPDASGNYSFATVAVRVSLTRHGCWVVSGRQTQALLNHEQLHYWIATLVGRELDAEVTALTASSPAQLLAAGRNLHTQKIQRAHAIEAAYDLATQHSRLAVQQDVWAHRVDAWDRNNYRIAWP